MRQLFACLRSRLLPFNGGVHKSQCLILKLLSTELESLFSPDEEFFSWFDETSPENCRQALDDLETYIASEGPFDAVMAFSQGATLAATLMVRRSKQDAESLTDPSFKCAIFMSGGVPGDPAALEQDKVRTLDHVTDGEVIRVPTAHVWGANDQRLSSFGPVLSKLCRATLRTVYVHDGGHEVPGPRNQAALNSTVMAVQRTIDMVLSAQ